MGLEELMPILTLALEWFLSEGSNAHIIDGLVLVPVAWAFSRLLWLLAFLLLAVGAALFYTERKREEALEKEADGGACHGTAVPTDIHNYTGWRSGGRRDNG